MAAACVWTNPKPEFIELKYYREIVYGEREGMRVWVWGWVHIQHACGGLLPCYVHSWF